MDWRYSDEEQDRIDRMHENHWEEEANPPPVSRSKQWSVVFAGGADGHVYCWPGQFDCFLDAARAVRRVYPDAACSSVGGPRYKIMESGALDAKCIGEVVFGPLGVIGGVEWERP